MKKFLFPLILVFLYSCSNITVTADYDKEVDFAKYKTFSFLQWRNDNNKLINEFDKSGLVKAVKTEMIERNYTFQQTDGELAISIYVILEDKTAYNSYTDY